jgi:carbon storage regulator
MLVLSRKKSESVLIDSTIQITVVSISKSRIKLGISAPNDVPIVREEVVSCQPGMAVTEEQPWLQHARV